MIKTLRDLDCVPAQEMIRHASKADSASLLGVLSKDRLDLWDLAILLSPEASRSLEVLAQRASALTVQRFGRTVQLYAPIYLSNECVNVCTYCGFRRDLGGSRLTLDPVEVVREAEFLTRQGFRHLLLVSGEHPKNVTLEYLTEVVELVRTRATSVSIEVQPLSFDGYGKLVAAGTDGVTLYQEVYDRELYSRYHTHGPKRKYDDRLEAPSRAARAGIRRIGIGTLLGLAPWRTEALRLAAHTRFLIKSFWKTEFSLSFPRIHEATVADGFRGPFPVGDRELAQMICALRIFLPEVSLVLSTRESAELRDGLVKVGINCMSAGSRTDPGGYLSAHAAREQFRLYDRRTPTEVAQRLRELGLDPVWKDWEEVLHG